MSSTQPIGPATKRSREPDPVIATSTSTSAPCAGEPAATPTTSPGLGQEGAGPRMRSSQAERERTVTALHQALLDGRLDLDETEARQSQAYATQYRDDLPPLLADLPSNSGSLGGSERAPSWSELADAFLWRLHALAHGPMTVRPSTRQRRAVIAVLTALAMWTILWIIVGAVAVAG